MKSLCAVLLLCTVVYSKSTTKDEQTVSNTVNAILEKRVFNNLPFSGRGLKANSPNGRNVQQRNTNAGANNQLAVKDVNPVENESPNQHVSAVRLYARGCENPRIAELVFLLNQFEIATYGADQATGLGDLTIFSCIIMNIESLRDLAGFLGVYEAYLRDEYPFYVAYYSTLADIYRRDRPTFDPVEDALIIAEIDAALALYEFLVIEGLFNLQ